MLTSDEQVAAVAQWVDSDHTSVDAAALPPDPVVAAAVALERHYGAFSDPVFGPEVLVEVARRALDAAREHDRVRVLARQLIDRVPEDGSRVHQLAYDLRCALDS